MGTLILTFLLVAVTSAFPLLQNRVNYDNYKVYRFVPKTKVEVMALSGLENKYPGQVWNILKNHLEKLVVLNANIFIMIV